MTAARRLLGALGVTFVVGVTAAPLVFAQSPPTTTPGPTTTTMPTAITINITSPKPGDTMTTQSFDVQGRLTLPPNVSINTVQVTFTSMADPNKPRSSKPIDAGCGSDGKTKCSDAQSGQVPFVAHADACSIFNGPNNIIATVTGVDHGNNDRPAEGKSDSPTDVKVDAKPPAKPVTFSVTLDNKTRVVNLAWDRNCEPDTYKYTVTRTGPSKADFDVKQNDSGQVKQPDGVPATSPGTYTYTVVAVRASGATADQTKDPVKSPPSDTKSVTVPPGPPSPPQPGGKTPAGSVNLKSPTGKGNLGRVGNGSGQGSAQSGDVPVGADDQFNENLPYGNVPKGGRKFSQIHTAGKHSSLRSVMAPVAVGGVFVVGAFQLRWLMGQLSAAGPDVLHPEHLELG